MVSKFSISELNTGNTKFTPDDVIRLLYKAGWGKPGNEIEYANKINKSWSFYETILFAHQESILIGYCTSYSDLSFSTGMGELIVHPGYRRIGVGEALIKAVKAKYPDIPFYVKTFKENIAFFESCGFKHRENMAVLSGTFHDDGT